MSDDETYKNKADILKSREEFPGWRRQMEMLAQDRGDVEGIFSDLGQNPNVGYQAIPPASVARRKAWNELSIKLSGKVGRKIDNAALSRIWADAKTWTNEFRERRAQEYLGIGGQGVSCADVMPFCGSLVLVHAPRTARCRCSEFRSPTHLSLLPVPAGGHGGARGGEHVIQNK